MKNNIFFTVFFLVLISLFFSCERNQNVKVNKSLVHLDSLDSDTNKREMKKVDFMEASKATSDIEFIKDLQVLAKNKDKNGIANLIVYPTTNIPNRTYFLDHYDSIMNSMVLDSLQVQNLDHLFRNYQGTMIGNGQVWVREYENSPFWRIIAINYK